MNIDDQDKMFMRKALALAEKGRGRTAPNPMVGAVIVKGGKTIAEGWHRRCGGDHAEIMALKKAGRSARGAKLYVTLEPCAHYGRTPPCLERVIESGIKEAVIAMKDPNPLTNGRSIRKMRKAGIKVRLNVLSDEAKRLNEAYLKYIRTGRPFVTAKCAQTLDGKTATSTGDSKWITSPATRRFAYKMRDRFDAIMVGIGTVTRDNPRLNGEKNKHIRKIILDSKLSISPKARVLSRTNAKDCLIVTTHQSSQAKRNKVVAKGATVLTVPRRYNKIPLKWVMKALGQEGIASVLIEGGASVVGSALKEGVVDKMHVYIASKILGDGTALSSVVGRDVDRISQAIRLDRVVLRTLNKDFFVEGYVHRHR